MRPIRRVLVGVRSHGGEEVYSTLLRDRPPEDVAGGATLDFHRSCAGARCDPLSEVLLNRLLHPWLRFDLGFRVLAVDDDVDLVHVHTHPTVLRKLRDRPVVFSTGSSHYLYVREYLGWPEQKIAARYRRAQSAYRTLGILDPLLNADRISLSYTFSDYGRDAYLKFGADPDTVRVLPPGFDIPPPVPRAEARDVTFLFMGREPARKGGPDVLAAFARLRETLPEARLLYVSDAPPERLLPGVEALPLVPPAATASLFARADVFVNPTRAEGFGFTNVEAQGFALPVISSRIGAVPEVVEDGRSGILIAPGRGQDLLEAMRRLAESSALRAEMGAAGRARFERLFSLEVFRRALRALYDEALDRAAR